jgi:hypothetical protein
MVSVAFCNNSDVFVSCPNIASMNHSIFGMLYKNANNLDYCAQVKWSDIKISAETLRLKDLWIVVAQKSGFSGLFGANNDPF